MKAAFLLALSVILVASAETKNEGLKDQLSGNGEYGIGGCGLGSMIFQPKEDQVFAATTNTVTGTQFLGITTGTSNCGVAKKTEPVTSDNLPDFIEVNRQALASEAVRGHGETISALAHFVPCKAEALQDILKTHFDEIFNQSKMEPAGIEAEISNFVGRDRRCFAASAKDGKTL